MTKLLRLAPLVLAVASCVERPPVWAPTPVASRETSAKCLRARALRARAPALLGEGRLDRAARVLQRAEDLCAVEAPATWGERVTALAMLGRSAEALQLVARIERSDRASDADRAAAAAARTLAEEHGRAIAAAGAHRDHPELFDPAEKKRAAAADLFRRGAAASRSGDHAAAKGLFVAAWNAWRPNPRALIEAGLEARALGDRVDAQRLWDRAAYDDAASAVRPEVPSGGPRALGGATLAWSPDGSRIAVGGDDEIVIFTNDIATILHIRTTETVTALAFASGDARVVAGFAGGRARIYDTIVASAPTMLQGHRGAVRAIAVSPDGRTIATAAADTPVRLWDAATGRSSRILPSPRPAIALAFRADGREIAWIDDAGAVAIADVASGAPRKLGRVRGAARAIAFEGASLIAVTATERLRFDLDRPRAPPRSLARGRADAASFRGGIVAIDTSSDLVAIDLASGDSIASTPSRDHGGVAAFALAPGAGAIAAVYRDRTISLLPAKDRKGRLDVGPTSPLATFAVAPSGKLFAGVHEDGRALLWGAAPADLASFDAPGVRAIAFSPDGLSLAAGGDGKIDLRDVAAGKQSHSLGVRGRVDCLAFSPDGLRIVAGTDAPAVSIFTPGIGRATRDLALQGGPVRAARFSPDGASLLLAPKEGVVLWRPDTHQASRLVPYGAEPRDVAFTPDGAGMIVADKRGALLLGKPVEKAPAPTRAIAIHSQVLALTVSGNGVIATAEGDRAVGLHGPTGQPIARFRVPEAAVRAVAVLPQGIVAASFADGAIRLFRAPGPGAAATLRLVPGLPAGALAGLVVAPSGHVELVGRDAQAARARLRGRVGDALYPFDVCADQFAMTGLLPMVLAGQDPAEADP